MNDHNKFLLSLMLEVAEAGGSDAKEQIEALKYYVDRPEELRELLRDVAQSEKDSQ